MANQEFDQYDNVRMALQRSKPPIRDAGSVATLLLRTFVKNGGKLLSRDAEKLGLCKKGEFCEWRQPLEDGEWLRIEVIEGKFTKHFPGRKLVKYVNLEKQANFELATTQDLLGYVSSEVHEALSQRVDGLEAALDEVIDILDPPSTPEKRKKLANGGYNRTLRMVATIEDDSEDLAEAVGPH